MPKKVKKKKKPVVVRPKISAFARLYQKKLQALREDIMKTVQAKERDLPTQETGDEADVASQSLEREILFEMSDNERVILDGIEAALRKIEQGTFGQCQSCSKKILRARLKAMPYARYCVSCQSKSETSRLGGGN